MDFCPRRATMRHEIYDIGTEILTRSRFSTKIIKSFYKSIIPQEIKSAGHFPSSGSVKIRFKAIKKSDLLGFAGGVFFDFCSPGGRLSCSLCFHHKMNLLGIWQIQKLEQVHPVSVPTLPASETINQTFKNMIYCRHQKNCMRPFFVGSWTQ